MKRTHVLIGVLAVAAVTTIGGAAFYTGWGPAPGGGDAGDTITDFPTATPTATPGGNGGAAMKTATPTPPPFDFTIDRIEECGRTCRDVTATLHNNQAEPATGVTVYVRIYAGQDTTEDDAMVWEGTEPVGTLEAGGAHTTTQRVELSLQEALKVEGNGGWVTIVTTVETDARTVTFRSSEQVA